MDLIAYGLTAENSGTVEIDGEEVPVFQGGVIATETGDIHLRDLLDDGDGDLIVLWEKDAELQLRLDALPAFKRVPVPKAPQVVVTPYDRMTLERLRAYAEVHQIKAAGSTSLKRLRAALVERDEQLHEAARSGEVVDPEITVADLLGDRDDASGSGGDGTDPAGRVSLGSTTDAGTAGATSITEGGAQ